MSEQLQHRFFTAFLILTAILCGGLIMVIEVLGSRVIGPFFGVGLFVWTSLIAVSLLSLAVGYGIGGWLSDKKAHPDTLYIIILVSGLLTLLIPYVKAPVLQAMLPLGLRMGTLSSAMILFSPPLLLLGFVSPYLIKIATKELHSVGKTVGLFYSLSTAGSVLGTVIAGFYLIPAMGVNTIFLATGFGLIALSVIYFLFFRRLWLVAPVLIIPFLLPSQSMVVDKTFANGTRLQQLFHTDTYYGKLQVVDYTNQQYHLRQMLIDGQPQGGIDMATRQSIFSYANYLTKIPYALHHGSKQGQRALVIGLGAGIVPMWFEERGVTTDIVEIDPEVLDVARQYFDYAISGNEYIEDARYFLTNSDKKYDFIMLDIYSGDLMPGHVVSTEAFTLIARLLKDGGVFGINWIDSLDEAHILSSLYKTMRESFEQVEIFPNFDVTEETRGNISVIAYQGEKRILTPSAFSYEDIHPQYRPEYVTAIGQNYQFVPADDAIVLTDDFNPVDVYNNQYREEIRLSILKTTDPDLLTL